MLLEKRQANQTVSDISDLVDKRIQGLLAASVILRLPNMTSAQREATKVKIDIALRTAKTLLSYGRTNLDKVFLKDDFDHPLNKVFCKSLKLVQDEIKTIPTVSAFAGIYFVGKTILSLMTSSGLVEIDN
jgi:hypothetical protein